LSINYESLFEVRAISLNCCVIIQISLPKNKHLLKMKEKYFLSATIFIILYGPPLEVQLGAAGINIIQV
jgi:hypothetical protein